MKEETNVNESEVGHKCLDFLDDLWLRGSVKRLKLDVEDSFLLGLFLQTRTILANDSIPRRERKVWT